MDLTGEWTTKEGDKLIITSFTKNSIRGRIKIKHVGDLKNFEFSGIILNNDTVKIEFCFCLESRIINQKKCMFVKCEINIWKKLLDANIIKYTVPNGEKGALEKENTIFRKQSCLEL